MIREEAMEIVKKLYNDSLFLRKDKEALETLIPELCKSEDERIRKEIKHQISLLEFYRFMAASKEECLAYLEKQKEQKPIVIVPKYRIGDIVLSTKNPRLTYKILEIGHINELNYPEYKVEIFTDGNSVDPANIKYIEIRHMDEWGELVEHKPAEKKKEQKPIFRNCSHC